MKRLKSKIVFGLSVLVLTSVGALLDANLHLLWRAESRENAITLRAGGRGELRIIFGMGAICGRSIPVPG